MTRSSPATSRHTRTAGAAMAEDPSLAYRRASDARRAAMGLAPLPGTLIPRIPAGEVLDRFPDLIPDGATVWCGLGWRPIVEEALQALRGQMVVVRGIREHCAGIQLLVGPRGAWAPEAFSVAGRVCDKARARSERTCEGCGEPGRPRIPGPGVRCDEHAAWR